MGEAKGFARVGEVINFTLEDAKVRFGGNMEAGRAGLQISYKLPTLVKVASDRSSVRWGKN